MNNKIIDFFIWYANRIAETVQYKNWSDDFCRKQINSSTDIFLNELKKYIDFSKLTREEAVTLRFEKWDDNSDLYLIPLYLLPIIPIGTELTCINGEKVVYDGTNIDNEIRFGCIAWGIHISERYNNK